MFVASGLALEWDSQYNYATSGIIGQGRKHSTSNSYFRKWGICTPYSNSRHPIVRLNGIFFSFINMLSNPIYCCLVLSSECYFFPELYGTNYILRSLQLDSTNIRKDLLILYE